MNSLRIVNLSLRPFILSDCVSGVLWHESVPCWTMRPVSDTDVSSQFHKITFSSVLGQLWNTNASLSVQLICLPQHFLPLLLQAENSGHLQPMNNKLSASGWEVQRKIFSDCTSLVSFFSGIFTGIMDKIGGESELLVFSLRGNAFCLFAVINDYHVYWDTPAQNLLATDCVRLSQLAEFGLDII